MKPKVEVETISEREHVLKVDGEIIGVSKTQYDALFHKHFLDRKFEDWHMIATNVHFAQVPGSPVRGQVLPSTWLRRLMG
jgi:hypothetical protein